MALTKLRRNILYEEGDIPAFLRIKESESWFRVLFWYIIFICFMCICVISVVTQYNEFMNNPTVTDVTIFTSTELQLPNISICLSDFYDFDSEIVWAPEVESTADGPTWLYKM